MKDRSVFCNKKIFLICSREAEPSCLEGYFNVVLSVCLEATSADSVADLWELSDDENHDEVRFFRF